MSWLSKRASGSHRSGVTLRNNIENWEAIKPPTKTVRKRSNLNGHKPVRGTGKLRYRVRPAPDIGQGKASLRFGPIEFKADGKGAAGAPASESLELPAWWR